MHNIHVRTVGRTPWSAADALVGPCFQCQAEPDECTALRNRTPAALGTSDRAPTVRVSVKTPRKPLLIVAALLEALWIQRDVQSRDQRERSGLEFSHRLVREGTACNVLPATAAWDTCMTTPGVRPAIGDTEYMKTGIFFLILAPVAFSQVDSSALRAKFGAPLNREVFTVRPGIEMIVDYSPTGTHACRLELPGQAPMPADWPVGVGSTRRSRSTACSRRSCRFRPGGSRVQALVLCRASIQCARRSTRICRSSSPRTAEDGRR